MDVTSGEEENGEDVPLFTANVDSTGNESPHHIMILLDI
jgi:hypothetical protein